MRKTKMFRGALAAICLTVGLASSRAALAASGGPAVHDAWARATPPGVTTGAVYLKIVGGDENDRLIRVRTEAAEAAEVHTEVSAGGVVTMKKLETLPVPAGAVITLAPGHDHLMLMGLKEPLRPGEKIDVTLTFEHAGDVAVEVPVRDARTSSREAPHEHSMPTHEGSAAAQPSKSMHGATEGPPASAETSKR
jgi:periplasmic copper chaperone A